MNDWTSPDDRTAQSAQVALLGLPLLIDEGRAIAERQAMTSAQLRLYLDKIAAAVAAVTGATLPAYHRPAVFQITITLPDRDLAPLEAYLADYQARYPGATQDDGLADLFQAALEGTNDTAQVLINSAKAEVDFIRATGQASSSGFIPTQASPARIGVAHQDGTEKTAHGTKTVVGAITTHRMK